MRRVTRNGCAITVTVGRSDTALVHDHVFHEHHNGLHQHEWRAGVLRLAPQTIAIRRPSSLPCRHQLDLCQGHHGCRMHGDRFQRQHQLLQLHGDGARSHPAASAHRVGRNERRHLLAAGLHVLRLGGKQATSLCGNGRPVPPSWKSPGQTIRRAGSARCAEQVFPAARNVAMKERRKRASSRVIQLAGFGAGIALQKLRGNLSPVAQPTTHSRPRHRMSGCRDSGRDCCGCRTPSSACRWDCSSLQLAGCRNQELTPF